MNVLYWKSTPKGYVISLYRSPSQSKDEFDQFLLNFEQLTSDRMNQNLHFILVTGDFNLRSSSWWKNDVTTSESNQVDAITSSQVNLFVNLHIFCQVRPLAMI